MTQPPLRIGIVGAGIAGLTAALALRNGGHDATVFERSPTLRTFGGAILLWPAALRQLELLGTGRELHEFAMPLRAHEFRSGRGEVFLTLPLAELESRHGSTCWLVRRADLLSLLARTLGMESVACGKRGARLELLEAQAELQFADATSARFDLVIGADGIHSSIRPYVVDGSEIRSGRRTAWAGIAPGNHPIVEPGVAVSYVGAGVTFLYAGLKNGSTYWYSTVPAEQARDFASLQHCLRDVPEPAADLFEATPRDELYVTEIRDRGPARPWSRGRVVLVGDSIHPCAPDLGQGACQAIESACCLASHLAHLPVATALRAYEEERFKRCSLVTTASSGSLLQTILEDTRMGATFPAIARVAAPLLRRNFLDWLVGPVT